MIREEIEEVKQELNKIKDENFATIILHDYKQVNKRMFIIVLALLMCLILSFGYIIYLLNDIQTNYKKTIVESDSGIATYLEDSNSGDIIYGKDNEN